jgi:hypothetical protein
LYARKHSDIAQKDDQSSIIFLIRGPEKELGSRQAGSVAHKQKKFNGTLKQSCGSGSGSAWIGFFWLCWIRIRIPNTDPDQVQGAWKLTKNTNISGFLPSKRVLYLLWYVF